MSKKSTCFVAALVMVWSVSQAVAQPPAGTPGKGKVLFEYFFDIGAGTAVTDLTSNAKFPNSPDSSAWLDNFLHPAGGTGGVDWRNNYGARGRAYVYPPQSGDYTFWVSGDDLCELWLSTDDNPANAKMIAQVTGWTPAQAWDGAGGSTDTAALKSAPIALKAGQKYYIEGLMKEAGGGDSLGVAWGGPGIGAGPVLLAGKYCAAWIRSPEPMFLAQNPSPADGATGVLAAFLTWTKGGSAQFHDVYFGTDPNPPFISRTPMAMYYHVAGLTPGTTYYWRIDEVEIDGKTIYTGPIWSFVSAPLAAFGPAPRNGDKWIDPNSDLTWQPGSTAQTHDVYFGTDKDAVANRDASVKKATGQAVPAFELPALEAATTYYWLVDEYDATGTKYEGAVWSFTTQNPASPGGVKAEYFRNMTVSGAPFLTQIEPAIDHSWADGTGPAPGVTDQFSVRWTADLEIVIADTYTFTANTDDGTRVWLGDDLIIDSWIDKGASDILSSPITLEPGIYALRMEYYENGSGASAQLYWAGKTFARELIPAGPLQPPVRAKPINPKDGDVNVPQDVALMWSVGEKAVSHNVYFGEDEAAVAAATPADGALFKGSQVKEENSWTPGALEWNKTYYWRVDEVNDASAESPWKGGVSSFTTANFLVVDNFDSYVDEIEGRIFQTWIDGWGYTEPAPGNPGNGTCSTVGYTDPPFAENVIVHSGSQSMPFDYNNTTQPYYAETDRTFATAQNWKVNGVNTLVLYFQGYGARFLDDGTTITMSAAGNDIWNNADQFRFAYKRLNGDGSITAKVNGIVQTDGWAKAGVMIRESLLAGSANAANIVSAANGASFQWRPFTDDVSANTPHTGVAAPYWVRLTRTGNSIKAEDSVDGKTWAIVGTDATLNPHDVVMGSSIYIGLCVTSHNTNPKIATTGVFSDIKTTGGVSGQWQVADIGIVHPGNDVESLYVAVQDSAGKVAVVTNPDAQAVLSSTWTEWKIPTSSFTGVNLGSVKKMFIGVGDRTAPKAGGHGKLFIDDIRVIME